MPLSRDLLVQRGYIDSRGGCVIVVCSGAGRLLVKIDFI